MILTGLKPLGKSIRQNSMTYGLFDFRRSGVDFHVLFDINVEPYRLMILAQGSTFELELEIKRGFVINPFIDAKKYKELIRLLNLKYDPENKFSSTVFFQELNDKIPSTYIKPAKRVLLEFATNRYNIEKANKVYFKGFIPWKKRERSEKNTEKTRILLPLVHERIKDRIHLSVAYTDVPNNIEYADPDDLSYRLREDYIE